MELWKPTKLLGGFGVKTRRKEEARVHPIIPSPKAFLILDELSLSSIRSQLTSRTTTARVPDQTRSVPARASARVHSSSFQPAFQACSSSRPV
ncbi:hypothetical protein F2Q70_00004955 [Brassica cretica]|uniref:Uncharacterized protein n=1 Tax=Brassica cretica TaxID=69181 RepID=A0A8S9IP76_BRACR|nr:hypothetical protein F2Q70_00004955 [Brassica cretica]